MSDAFITGGRYHTKKMDYGVEFAACLFFVFTRTCFFCFDREIFVSLGRFLYTFSTNNRSSNNIIFEIFDVDQLKYKHLIYIWNKKYPLQAAC
jgi:hypothetical protein